MGVRSVSGQEMAALLPSSLSRRPSPQPRNAEPAKEAVTTERASPSPAVKETEGNAQPVVENPAMRRAGTRLHVDAESKRIVAQIIDKNNQVIKQIPPEELLEISAKMRELQSLLFDESV